MSKEKLDKINDPNIIKVYVMGYDKIDNLGWNGACNWVDDVMTEIFDGHEKDAVLISSGYTGYAKLARDWADSKLVTVKTTGLDFVQIHEQIGVDLLVLFPGLETIEYVERMMKERMGDKIPPISFNDARTMPNEYEQFSATHKSNPAIGKPADSKENKKYAEVIKNLKPTTVDPNNIPAYIKIQKYPYADSQSILDVNQQIINNYIKAGGKL